MNLTELKELYQQTTKRLKSKQVATEMQKIEELIYKACLDGRDSIHVGASEITLATLDELVDKGFTLDRNLCGRLTIRISGWAAK